MKLEAGRLRLSASDVANFLACAHLTRLDMLSAQGRLRPPHASDAHFQDLVARGEAHERVVRDGFTACGPACCLPPTGEPRPDGLQFEVVDAKLARSAKARAVQFGMPG
jgi:hypothetical protein